MKTREYTREDTKMYRVPGEIVAWAEAEAVKRGHQTKKPVWWTDIIREVLERATK